MENFRERRGGDCKIERIVNKLVKSLSESEHQEWTVITKPKAPPIWNTETFKRYKDQVEHWNTDSNNLNLNKYFDLIEALKRKKDLKEYVINNVLDKTQLEGKTVAKILEVPGEKFMQTIAEKMQAMLEKITKIQKVEEN